VRRFLRGDRGQATVELALIFSILILPLVMGVLEMGYLMSQGMNVNTASREGARVGGMLANGGGPLGCQPGVPGGSPNADNVDPQIIAAVERSLTANGALINLANVTEIRIFKATLSGGETAGKVNVWTYKLNGGPVIDGQALDFKESSNTWNACSRLNTLPADSVGVMVKYSYRARTPLRYFFPGLATIEISDRTVMTLNATQ
jgi:hypothetical protein